MSRAVCFAEGRRAPRAPRALPPCTHSTAPASSNSGSISAASLPGWRVRRARYNPTNHTWCRPRCAAARLGGRAAELRALGARTEVLLAVDAHQGGTEHAPSGLEHPALRRVLWQLGVECARGVRTRWSSAARSDIAAAGCEQALLSAAAASPQQVAIAARAARRSSDVTPHTHCPATHQAGPPSNCRAHTSHRVSLPFTLLRSRWTSQC
jgi:hypothetical protein